MRFVTSVSSRSSAPGSSAWQDGEEEGVEDVEHAPLLRVRLLLASGRGRGLPWLSFSPELGASSLFTGEGTTASGCRLLSTLYVFCPGRIPSTAAKIPTKGRLWITSGLG